MTTTLPSTPALPEIVPTVAGTVSPKLEALCAQYDQAKAQADAAAKVLKEITDGIKVELITAAPGVEKVDLASDFLARPLRLQAITSWRVDAIKLKAENPLLYVQYARESVAWHLKAVGR